MKKKHVAVLAVGFFFCGLASVASALEVSRSIEYGSAYLDPLGTGKSVDFVFTDLPKYPSSDMTVEFWVRDDLNSTTECIDITADTDGYDFGTWLNGNSSDDTIDGSDSGSQCGASLSYGSSTIPQSQLSSLVEDGTLIFNVSLGDG